MIRFECSREAHSNIFKGTVKSYYKHYSFVVIILFNRGLYKSAFSTYSSGKLIFGLWFRFYLYRLNNFCVSISDIYVRCSENLFSLLEAIYKSIKNVF